MKGTNELGLKKYSCSTMHILKHKFEEKQKDDTDGLLIFVLALTKY